MKENITRIFQFITQDILEIVHIILAENNLDDSQISENVQVTQIAEDDPVINIIFSNYITYIEEGRRPDSAKMPPISAIRDWAERKGISTDNNILYAIAESIRRDGIAPRPIFAKIMEKVQYKYENEWSTTIEKIITEELDSYFTD